MPAKLKKSALIPPSPMRSFRVRYQGGIVLPTTHECNLFFHSHYGILILLLLLICNFSYINVLAAPPAVVVPSLPAPTTEESFNEESIDRMYQKEITILLKDYFHQRSLFARTLSGGADIGEAAHTWLLNIGRIREKLLLMKLPSHRKDFHLGFIYLLAQDESVAGSMRNEGVTVVHGNDFREVEANLSVLLRTYPQILLTDNIE